MSEPATVIRYLVAYAERIIGQLGDAAGMDRPRKREYLHACLARWKAAYGSAVAEAVEAAIRVKWRAA